MSKKNKHSITNEPAFREEVQLINISQKMLMVSETSYAQLCEDKRALEQQLLQKTHNEKILEETITQNGKIIDELKREKAELIQRISDMDQQIRILIEEKKRTEATIKLNECHTLVNNVFKREYKGHFKPKRSDNIPNIGDFIDDPPNDTDEPECAEFWNNFRKKYPESDNADFAIIRSAVRDDRIRHAHPNIKNMSCDDVIEAVKLVLPEVFNNKLLLNKYVNGCFFLTKYHRAMVCCSVCLP